MIYTIVQFLTALVYPLNLAMILALLGGLLILLRRRRLGGLMLATGLAVLIAFSMPLTAGFLVKTLERRHLPVPLEQMPAADAIVVLGGSVRPAHPPRPYPELTSASDRELHTARLFQADKAPWVVVSGEPDGGRRLLREFGIPDANILEDEQSRNTRENALYALQIMEQRDDIDSILLVTSAMHMPRALATFQRLEIEVTAAPTDYNIADAPEAPGGRARPFVFSLLPSASALHLSTRAIHEYLGILYYRLRGWI